MVKRTATFLSLGSIALASSWLVIDIRTFAQTTSTIAAPKATLTVRALGYVRGGSQGGSATRIDVTAGASLEVYTMTGAVSPSTNLLSGFKVSSDELCGTSLSSSAPGRRGRLDVREARYAWQLDVKMLSVETDKVTFDVALARTHRVAPMETIRNTFHLTLREDEPRIIDLVHGSPSSRCDTVVIDISASVAEESAAKSRSIEWDLWLNNGRAAGVAQRRVTTRHGQAELFDFEPVKTTSMQLDGKAEESFAHLTGQVRGHVRPDGTIDAALSTGRSVGVDPTAFST